MSNLDKTDKCYSNLRKLVQELLEIESERLGCSISEVMPFHQPPESKQDTQITSSTFADLPFEMFCKITENLELIDLYQMRCVCKKWSYLAVENLKEVQKVECSFPTHLLRFRKWIMACSFSPVASYQISSIKLTKWAVHNSVNLQILVIDSIVKWKDFVVLLDCCPVLKHLFLTVDQDDFTTKFQTERHSAFSNLKTFVLHQVGSLNKCMNWVLPEELTICSFITNRVCGFDSTMSYGDQLWVCPLIDFASPGQSFYNLKYLRLDVCSFSYFGGAQCFARCLQNCPELLVLILNDHVTVGNFVLRSLQFCSKLKVLWMVNNHISDQFNALEIQNLYNALHEVDPKRSFEEFFIIAMGFQIIEFREAAPFNFLERGCESIVPDRFAVRSPYMKQILNTPF